MLKNNIFTFGKTTLKQKWGTATGTKLAPPYSILLTVEMQEEIIKEYNINRIYGRGTFTTCFFMGE